MMGINVIAIILELKKNSVHSGKPNGKLLSPRAQSFPLLSLGAEVIFTVIASTLYTANVSSGSRVWEVAEFFLDILGKIPVSQSPAFPPPMTPRSENDT